MRYVDGVLVAIVLVVSTGYAGDVADGPAPPKNGANSDVAEEGSPGGQAVDAPKAGLLDPHQLPPMKLALRADDRGELASIHLNQKRFTCGEWGALRGFLIGVLGEERGPGSIQAAAAIELDCDENLRYEHVIDAITAVSGYLDENDKVVKLVEKIKFSPPKKSTHTEPAKPGRDEPESPPKRGPAKRPVAPQEDPVSLDLTELGAIILDDQTLEKDALIRHMKTQRRKLLAMGKKANEVTVIIRAHKDCPTGKIQELIGVCQQQGFERFALRARVQGYGTLGPADGP